MRLSEYASTQRTYGSRKVPRSVQQSIPIDQIYEDGTWRCGNVYSQMWSMPDINFTMSDEDNKAKILNLLGKVYMGVPSDCWLKICIVSQRMDEKSFRENVLLHRNLDGLDKWRVERNRRIRQSMSVKMEIIMEFLRWPNARFILVDPENEYELLVKALGGEAIKVSVDSRTHFNPLDYHYDPKTDVPPDVAKIEFVLSMLDKLIGENGHLQPEDRSLIAASLKNIYKPLIASGYTAPCPTLGDLYRDLNKSNLRRAKQLALMLDVFANGSLQAFSHTTNVDMNNRLICFNIQSLGDQLRPIAMMSLLEFINMQVMTNRRKDATAATWIYFDEIHVLLKDPMSSNFLYTNKEKTKCHCSSYLHQIYPHMI